MCVSVGVNHCVIVLFSIPFAIISSKSSVYLLNVIYIKYVLFAFMESNTRVNGGVLLLLLFFWEIMR